MKRQLPPKAAGSVLQAPVKTEITHEVDLLTMDEAIAMLKTTRPTFYRWLRSGQIKGMKVGRQWRFVRQDIDRFVQGQGPRIDLAADIDPLIDELTSKLKALGIRNGMPEHSGKIDRTVNLVIRLATAMNASDIHIDPQKGGAQLRFRVDGMLHLVCKFDMRLLPAIAERWKTLAALDVREKAIPQDGKIMAVFDDKNLDIRVSCMPAYLGEAITARLLRYDNVFIDLEGIDYAPNDRQRLDKYLGAPWGIILVTGPTGSGKTTTLYSCLNKVVGVGTKAISIEDPVEYLLAGVTQVQINMKEGLTFERALRSILRSDPDVIMVGEIRNSETMQVCFQAALTGHLVMTTLHVDEASGALRRMIDMGAEPFLVADTTKLILAQRLVRRLCTECSIEAMPTPEQLSTAERLARCGGLGWGGLPGKYRRAVGCKRCGQLGYHGRTPIAETLEMTPEIASALRRKASTEEIRAIAVGQGMTTMAADGIRRAAEGTVSLQEVLSTIGSISY